MRVRSALPLLALVIFAAALHVAAKGTGLYDDLALLPPDTPAPGFNLRGLDNEPVRLSLLKGRVVWIIFGRTDHGASKLQLREAREIAAEIGDDDLSILFLAQSEDFSAVRSFVVENGSPAAMLFDAGGRVARRYAVRDWPTSYLVGRDGAVVDGRRGVLRASDGRFINRVQSALRSGRKNRGAGGNAP
ncbi:MAG: TlpA family protein disulfide reductase [Deltaproteobacteria bacterium]|nr:TlpA family protein disulfide reductase [Deltaproteobacteria bacterium]